jgi:hypothetical protein
MRNPRALERVLFALEQIELLFERSNVSKRN